MLIGSTILSLPACRDHSDAATDPITWLNEERRALGLPPSDPLRGKELFVTKGCFICHAVHGAGGTVASPLDAPEDGRIVDPMVFAAAMWRGAQAMLTLQLLELGYQIDVSGDELRDLAAFASDPRAQQDFSLQGIPDFMREWMIDKPYWLDDSWPEQFLQRPKDEELPFDESAKSFNTVNQEQASHP
jgi:hypothetical protein